MLVAHTTTTALEEHYNLSVISNVTKVFARLSIINDCTARDIDVAVLAICTCASAGTSIASMSRKDVPFVTKVQQRPIVVIASQIHVSAPATIATIWPTIGDILGTVHVHRPATALTRAAAYLDVIYEVAFSHYFTLSKNSKMEASMLSLVGVLAQ